MTAEDLPFGVEPPVGLPMSAAVVCEYDQIPSDIDDMPPGPFLAGYLSLIDVSKISGYDEIIVLRAHQRMASFYHAATYRDMAALNTTMLTHDGYPQPDVEAAGMAAAEVRVATSPERGTCPRHRHCEPPRLRSPTRGGRTDSSPPAFAGEIPRGTRGRGGKPSRTTQLEPRSAPAEWILMVSLFDLAALGHLPQQVEGG